MKKSPWVERYMDEALWLVQHPRRINNHFTGTPARKRGARKRVSPDHDPLPALPALPHGIDERAGKRRLQKAEARGMLQRNTKNGTLRYDQAPASH